MSIDKLIQEAREKAITVFAEYIKQDQHGTQKSNHIREMIFVNAQLIAEHLLDLPEARAYYEALLENEGYVKVPALTAQDIEISKAFTEGFKMGKPGLQKGQADLKIGVKRMNVNDALKAYDEAVALAWKAYEEAVAPAWKAYDEAVTIAGKAYDEAVAPAEKRIQDIADRSGVQVVMTCNYCGHTGVDVHENTQRTYAGTFKTIGVCDNIRACSERMVQAVQEKAINTAELCPRCGADETVWREVFNEPHQPCSAPKREELGK